MPAKTKSGVEFYQLVYVCMGCIEIFGGGIQAIPINTKAVYPAWEWDGNLEAPTIEQEIAVVSGVHICRASLTAGIFKYHTDSTHRYGGYLGYALHFPAWYVENLALQECAAYN